MIPELLWGGLLISQVVISRTSVLITERLKI